MSFFPNELNGLYPLVKELASKGMVSIEFSYKDKEKPNDVWTVTTNFDLIPKEDWPKGTARAKESENSSAIYRLYSENGGSNGWRTLSLGSVRSIKSYMPVAEGQIPILKSLITV